MIFYWILFYFQVCGKYKFTILQGCKVVQGCWMNFGWLALFVPHGEVDVHHNLIYTWSFNWIVFLKSPSSYLENKWIQASLYDDVGWILDERWMKSIICVTRWRWPSLGSCMQLGLYSQHNKLLSCNCFVAIVSQACSQSVCMPHASEI